MRVFAFRRNSRVPGASKNLCRQRTSSVWNVAPSLFGRVFAPLASNAPPGQGLRYYENIVFGPGAANKWPPTEPLAVFHLVGEGAFLVYRLR